MSASDFPVVAAVALSRDDPYARRDQMFPKLSHDQLERCNPVDTSVRPPQANCSSTKVNRTFRSSSSCRVPSRFVHPSRGADEPITVHEPGEFTGEVDSLGPA